MELDEIKKIRKCNNENELIEIAEEIGDKIIFKGYEEKQVIALVNTLLGLDFLSMKYSTREEILSVLCDATANYKISKKKNKLKLVLKIRLKKLNQLIKKALITISI